MIDVGVIGCGSLPSAELIRVLINHPDVELKWVSGGCPDGMRLDAVVPGIVGECPLVVTDDAPLDDVDVVFVSGSRKDAACRLAGMSIPEDLRVIDMSGCHNNDFGDDSQWDYGLGEMQRRVLVHEARLVTVPGNAAAASLLALMPLARNLLINSPVELQVQMGETAMPLIDGRRATIDGMDAAEWASDQCREVTTALKACQTSFSQPVTMTVNPIDERRALVVEACLNCAVDADMVRELYEQYYDDHNFVFIVDRPIVTADVENTNKCLLRIHKDDASGRLTVQAVMDALLKGSAGNAVHAMNLMFGLHERVGLALKATGC